MFHYHVLLIGIDQYPPGFNSLSGCVSDIEAVERLLLDPPGVGIPVDQITITRLVAELPGRTVRERTGVRSQAPTKSNVVSALRHLAGPAVASSDRVLIYYSGHGDETLWPDSAVWHEALVPHNGADIEYLYDVEINALVTAIAARTGDLTIVLDSCHSAGATRGLTAPAGADGADRRLQGPADRRAKPDLSALSSESLVPTAAPGHLLQRLDPPYLVAVACQPDEKAGEGRVRGEPLAHGVFTHSLLGVLEALDAEARLALRWADIWPDLLGRVAERAAQIGRASQQPWCIGRPERRLFGGPWKEQDPGYQVSQWRDGGYTIGAGSLMGVTAHAIVAVYGPEPARFAPLGSPEDQPVGTLRVEHATRSTSIAVSSGEPFVLPEGARGRLIRAAPGGRLRVAIVPDDAALAVRLNRSPLVEVAPAGATDIEVDVRIGRDGGWTIGNDVEPVLARVPPGALDTLVAGLDVYYRVNAALRLARSCSLPGLDRALSLRLLDCSDREAVNAMSREALADPELPEVARDREGIPSVPRGTLCCVRIVNLSTDVLQVSLFNASAGGSIEHLGDSTLRPGAADVLWRAGELGQGFPATPDDLPMPNDGVQPAYVTDRLLAIGTTRRGVDLSVLRVDKTLQQFVDERMQRGLGRSMLGPPASDAPAELWTAVIQPLRIRR